MDLGIAGRKAIVCASSRGLGRACAFRLAEAGCEVIVNGLDPQRLDNTADEIRKATKAKVTAVAADVADADAGVVAPHGFGAGVQPHPDHQQGDLPRHRRRARARPRGRRPPEAGQHPVHDRGEEPRAWGHLVREPLPRCTGRRRQSPVLLLVRAVRPLERVLLPPARAPRLLRDRARPPDDRGDPVRAAHRSPSPPSTR